MRKAGAAVRSRVRSVRLPLSLSLPAAPSSGSTCQLQPCGNTGCFASWCRPVLIKPQLDLLLSNWCSRPFCDPFGGLSFALLLPVCPGAWNTSPVPVCVLLSGPRGCGGGAPLSSPRLAILIFLGGGGLTESPSSSATLVRLRYPAWGGHTDTDPPDGRGQGQAWLRLQPRSGSTDPCACTTPSVAPVPRRSEAGAGAAGGGALLAAGSAARLCATPSPHPGTVPEDTCPLARSDPSWVRRRAGRSASRRAPPAP